MRRRLALRVLRSLEPGTFLEAGCGWGELLAPLGQMGFRGIAVEPDAEARRIALTQVETPGIEISVVETIEQVDQAYFNYVLAFEVLEHLEDDIGELSKWTSKLRSGGLSLISVPAHMALWTAADDDVGHYRRYERADVIEMHDRAGLQIIELWSYGFPVASLTRRLRSLAPSCAARSDSMEDRTLASSHVSHTGLGRATPLRVGAMRAIGWLADLAQRPFLVSDRGDGYFVIARKE